MPTIAFPSQLVILDGATGKRPWRNNVLSSQYHSEQGNFERKYIHFLMRKLSNVNEHENQYTKVNQISICQQRFEYFM